MLFEVINGLVRFAVSMLQVRLWSVPERRVLDTADVHEVCQICSPWPSPRAVDFLS